MMAGIKDTDPRFQELYEKCRPYTMTSVEALYALYKSVEYIVASNLAGDFAESGVWRGGSCMLIAETLLAFGDSSRRIFLFDTFEGHPRPDAEKVDELFQWAFARKATPEQRDIALAHIAKNAANKKLAYENIVWALLNTKEFIFNQ